MTDNKNHESKSDQQRRVFSKSSTCNPAEQSSVDNEPEQRKDWDYKDNRCERIYVEMREQKVC